MDIANKYNEFLKRVSDFSGKNLKHEIAVNFIMKNAISQNKESVFNDLIFYSKYVTKLKRILKKNPPFDTEMIKKEFNTHIEKIKQLITSITSDNEEYKTLIDKYLLNSKESNTILLELIEDFSIIKDYQIDNKKLW
jgi:hypothetical protein